MIDSIRSLLKASKKGDELTSEQLAEAITKATAARDAQAAKLEELRSSMGPLLLDGTSQQIDARRKEIAQAGDDLAELDAVLPVLEARLAGARKREESARLDTALARAVEIVRGSRKVLTQYDTHAKGAGKALGQLRAMHAEWYDLRRELERAGREQDLVAALDGDGAATYGPGFVPGLGNIQDDGKVELPSLGYRAHWGSHNGAPPSEPAAPAEPDPMNIVTRYFPGAGGVWKMGTDGQYRCTRYGLTREQLIEQATEIEAGQRAGITVGSH